MKYHTILTFSNDQWLSKSFYKYKKIRWKFIKYMRLGESFVRYKKIKWNYPRFIYTCYLKSTLTSQTSIAIQSIDDQD